MQTIALYAMAALAEIGGCYAFWMWLRFKQSPYWAVGGSALLMLFAWLLTWVDMSFAGRAYAAYGGIYIAAALLWMRMVENAKPDRWDVIGVALCLAGVSVIVFAPRVS
jgi:small multidrug resistance family-3 protein